jgi:hypothetical protein
MCAGAVGLEWGKLREGFARRVHVTCARTLQGLVALADASAQCSRSGASSAESGSGFATPPPPSSFRLLWGDSEHANFAGKIDSLNSLSFPAPADKHGACSWARGCCVQAETWDVSNVTPCCRNLRRKRQKITAPVVLFLDEG